MKNLTLISFVVLFSFSLIHAQEEQSEVKIKGNVHVKVKDGAKPDIYVDGKKFDFPMELIDKEKIESVTVLKGEEALKEYNAKNGVVLITTKEKLVIKEKIKIKTTDDGIYEGPLIIIDGNESTEVILKELDPDDIENIKVIKDEQALIKYNSANGVIIITTKKN